MSHESRIQSRIQSRMSGDSRMSHESPMPRSLWSPQNLDSSWGKGPNDTPGDRARNLSQKGLRHKRLPTELRRGY